MIELRERERRMLLTIRRLGGKASVEQLISESGLSHAAAMRTALALKEKNLVKIHEEKHSIVKLNEEGKIHAKKGLPERRLVNTLEKLKGRIPLEKIVEKAVLERQFVPIALGWIQRKRWATLDSEAGTLKIIEKPKEGNDEKLLKLLGEKGQATVEELSSELQEAINILKKRKLLVIDEKMKRTLEITDEGKKALVKERRAVKEITQLTPELIISGKWRKAKLQKYNIEAPVAKTWLGKKHPYLRFLDEVKRKLVALGFKEMVGTVVETSFFNFDALYTPQGHPAREPTSVYYVKAPKYGSVNAYKHALVNVKKTHENGWKTNSSGWKYKYSVREAGRLILRSHTTCLSARTLLNKDLEIPSMYFSIGRCYRPEVLDKTHLTEFNQVEGIVVDKDLTLRDLLGVLEKFAIDIAGADKAKFVPDYFPFTEPSVELRAFKKGYGWIEFGGSGIFRPEVTLPLGIEVPVLAWGLGIDRLYMLKAGIDDIRQIFSLDLNWLRKQEVV